MAKLEILCVTMHQTDFKKVEEMNIRSNVVFANQCDLTAYEEKQFDGFTAKMISTETRGVGVNRNLSLAYASADICLLADDDVVYDDDMEARVLAEFDAHPDADVMIFHFDTDSDRKQVKYAKTKKCGRFARQPWAAFRVAFRLSAIRKANLHFTTLFGGGCLFPSGEDSMFLADMKKAGLRIYVSRETIGTVSFAVSSWFTGVDEKFFFGKGALYAALGRRPFALWARYFVMRMRGAGNLSARARKRWIYHGRRAYREMLSFAEYKEKYGL